jgi:hypothetical protein
VGRRAGLGSHKTEELKQAAAKSLNRLADMRAWVGGGKALDAIKLKAKQAAAEPKEAAAESLNRMPERGGTGWGMCGRGWGEGQALEATKPESLNRPQRRA